MATQNKTNIRTDKMVYTVPKMEVIETGAVELLSSSDESLNGGRENACLHGSHAWFCNND